MGDGCNMEGVSNEAASLAGHWGLGKLICFYDDNQISIDGNTEISFTEDVNARYAALGWHTVHVKVPLPAHRRLAPGSWNVSGDKWLKESWTRLLMRALAEVTHKAARKIRYQATRRSCKGRQARSA